MANKRNSKEIQRDTRLEIRMSKEEKELFYKYAENIGINPSRLARNILMMEAESLYNKKLLTPVLKAYIKYAEVTNNQEVLDRLKSD